MSAFISVSLTAGGGGIGAAASLDTLSIGLRIDSAKYASSNVTVASGPP